MKPPVVISVSPRLLKEYDGAIRRGSVADALLEISDGDKPDTLVFDLLLTDRAASMEAAKSLRRKYPTIKLVVVSNDDGAEADELLTYFDEIQRL